MIPLAERIAIVASINCVDEAIAETKPHKIDTWRDVGFDAIFKGDDWRGTPKGLALEREFAASVSKLSIFPTHSTPPAPCCARLWKSPSIRDRPVPSRPCFTTILHETGGNL